MGQGGRIDVYVDIASFYSYVAFLYLRRDAPIYAAHAVDLVFHPVLLGAINKATGNQPPFTLPAKARYGAYDVRRTCTRARMPAATRPPPDFFQRAHTVLPLRALTVLPLRALHHIRAHYRPDAYLAALHYLFYRFWTPLPDHADLRQPAVLRAVLAAAPAGFNGPGTTANKGTPLFTPADVDAILAAATAQPAKDQLTAATHEAVARGAFGSPWLWVQNSTGETEPFFGSDRFHFIYQFLGLPYQDVALLEAPQTAETKTNPRL